MKANYATSPIWFSVVSRGSPGARIAQSVGDKMLDLRDKSGSSRPDVSDTGWLHEGYHLL